MNNNFKNKLKDNKQSFVFIIGPVMLYFCFLIIFACYRYYSENNRKEKIFNTNIHDAALRLYTDEHKALQELNKTLQARNDKLIQEIFNVVQNSYELDTSQKDSLKIITDNYNKERKILTDLIEKINTVFNISQITEQNYLFEDNNKIRQVDKYFDRKLFKSIFYNLDGKIKTIIEFSLINGERIKEIKYFDDGIKIYSIIDYLGNKRFKETIFKDNDNKVDSIIYYDSNESKEKHVFYKDFEKDFDKDSFDKIIEYKDDIIQKEIIYNGKIKTENEYSKYGKRIIITTKFYNGFKLETIFYLDKGDNKIYGTVEYGDHNNKIRAIKSIDRNYFAHEFLSDERYKDFYYEFKNKYDK